MLDGMAAALADVFRWQLLGEAAALALAAGAVAVWRRNRPAPPGAPAGRETPRVGGTRRSS